MSRNQSKNKATAGEASQRPKPPASRKKPNKYVEAFKACKFVQTRWPHKPTLEALGLLDDVTTILENIGLGKVLDMDYLAYPDELAQMMGTFELDIKECYPPPPVEALGCVKFTVNEVNYELSIKQLCEAYGFKQVHGGKFRPNTDLDGNFWRQIGYEKWQGSRCKASTISNPSVRYVHKTLANTLFARMEADKVKEDELHLLMNGLFPLFERDFKFDGIVCYEGLKELNLGVLLARSVLRLKLEWVLRQTAKSKVYIGGFLTPLLHACGVPLGDPSPSKRAYMDVDNLKFVKFLEKQILDKFAYKFTNARGEENCIELPNRLATGLQGLGASYTNLRFTYGDAHKVDNERSNKRAKTNPEASNPQALPLGSSRYYQDPYQGIISSHGLRHAINGVSKNQRHNKWLTKSLHNVTKGLGKKLKKMAGQIKDLNSLVGTYVLGRRSPPQHQDGSTNMEAALEEARSYYASLQPHPTSMEQGESSRRRIPTPSPPSSDNELYHYSDSNSE